LLRKKLGLRYLMSVVGLQAGAAAVRGSHGRLPADPADGPVLLCSDPTRAVDRVSATEVKGLLLDLAGLTGEGRAGPGPNRPDRSPRRNPPAPRTRHS
jgi:hypothetical protein